MKQVLQNLRTGATEVAEVPRPGARSGHVLIRTTTTLVSVGTERMLVNFGRASLIGKARAQPERVGQVLDKVRTDGLIPTVQSVLNKLDQPLPLGYCNVGVVLEVGDDVTTFSVGDRVVSNGAHAEIVNVPKNLCVAIPDTVSDDAAAFTVLGAIGLQGIRLLEPTIGESVAVIGLGLIGLLAVQILRAHGCRVLGIDYDSDRIRLAGQFGAETVDLSDSSDPVPAALRFSRGRGIDAVLITASTTSNDPIDQAATMCRKRGRIVLVGTSGLEINRTPFYEKELSFRVSCSYGPGRYDPDYESRGIDYPAAYVRWTEQRNFEAVLDLISSESIETSQLISHRFPIADASEAYERVASGSSTLGILLTYLETDDQFQTAQRQRSVEVTHPSSSTPRRASRTSGATIGLLGSGNYAMAVLIPALRKAGARLRVVASSGGVSAAHAARKFGFELATTDPESALADKDVNAVVIATRHDAHARLVRSALSAGKHVFVEKPLALTLEELDSIEELRQEQTNAVLTVGFNRRFAPHIIQMKALLASARDPMTCVITVNAGYIPPQHWTQDPSEGGGRIIGEGCHFIDLLRFLVGSDISEFRASGLANERSPVDTATITLAFRNGSIGTIHYLTNGHRRFPKERIEVFVGGRILSLDNFRTLHAYGWPGVRPRRLWRQDKGQMACVRSFVQAVATNSGPPIPMAELMEVSRVTIEVAAALR